jgi:UDP-glucuronate 4-epimerase
MNILITGGAGFIGSHLIDVLLKNGDVVYCIDNFDSFYLKEIKILNLSEAFKSPNFKLFEGDVRDKEFLINFFRNNPVDLVVHLAAKAGVRPSITNPVEYFDVNITGTLNILEVMREANIKKMIFASSSSVYGNNKKIPFSEHDDVSLPISPYAASKKAGELVCHTYHSLYGINITCLRFFTVYGPRQRPDLAICNFADRILKGKEIIIFGDGTYKRDFTFITDIVDGIIAAIQYLNGFQIFNLGNSKPVEINYLVKLLEKALSQKAIIKYSDKQLGDVALTYADISEANKKLGYFPTVNIEEGIKRFINWFKK